MEPGGALAFSWDSTRAGRDEMTALVEDLSPLRVVRDAPYDDSRASRGPGHQAPRRHRGQDGLTLVGTRMAMVGDLGRRQAA